MVELIGRVAERSKRGNERKDCVGSSSLSTPLFIRRPSTGGIADDAVWKILDRSVDINGEKFRERTTCFQDTAP